MVPTLGNLEFCGGITLFRTRHGILPFETKTRAYAMF